MSDDLKKKDETYWKSKLTDEQYTVCRLGGTEAPFSGKYVDNHEEGTYTCVACHTPLFASTHKFESHSGWPSFFQPVEDGKIEFIEDHSHGMERTEVRCATCGSHLGHVFDDGPAPTKKRFCINSMALEFEAKE